LERYQTERPVFFGIGSSLFGIATEPHDAEHARRAVILLNAGADSHIGSNRMHVTLARRWCRRGAVVLRIDLAGIGDSATRAGCPDDEVFPPAALEDLRAAIEFVTARYPAAEITMAGLCSGAYHALRAAVTGLPVSCILMLNPQNYFWDDDMTFNDLQVAEVVRNPGVYRLRVLSAFAWRRLLSGQVNVWRIIMIFIQRLMLAMESSCRDLARHLRIRLPRDLGWELEEVASRGVRMIFVFARGEPGIGLLRLQAGSSVRKLGARCRLRILESGDHTFTHSSTRTALEDALTDELFGQIQ